jgi:transposase InsO family protein
VHRLYREERLQVQRRRRRKGVAVERRPLVAPDRPNQVWSMDFVSCQRRSNSDPPSGLNAEVELTHLGP